MIVIRKADEYFICDACGGNKYVKEIRGGKIFDIVIGYKVIARLCEDCRKFLMEKIKDEFTEYGI